MTGHRLGLPSQFDTCEAEDLRTTGAVQSGVGLVAIGPQGLVAATRDCLELPAEVLAHLETAPATVQIGQRHDRLDLGEAGIWLRHRQGGHVIAERIRHAAVDRQDHGAYRSAPALSEEALGAAAQGNAWKLSFYVCKTLSDLLACSRVMIYRFHADWSGEVIAEHVSNFGQPFLGLHYPATDIPSQARRMFLDIRTRHIFNTTRSDDPVLAAPGPPGAPVDLCYALSRSVSPYHIEYLRNMGSASTAACSIIINGRLWGLISLHFDVERQPSLSEFELLQDFGTVFNRTLTETLARQQSEAEKRAARLVSGFQSTMNRTGDIIPTIFFSELSLQRLVGAQGSCLVLDGRSCSVGLAPDQDVISALCALAAGSLSDALNSGPVFFDCLPEGVPQDGRNGVAGVAMARIGGAQGAVLLLFRKAVSQTVAWGGDPRLTGTGDEQVRYSPRQSFETWIEQVEGTSLPWSDTTQHILSRTINVLDQLSPGELIAELNREYSELATRRGLLQDSAVDVLNGIRTAIAVAIEVRDGAEQRVFALNGAADDALALDPTEVQVLDPAGIEQALGIQLNPDSNQTYRTSMVTANQGLRDCEVSVTLLVDYQDTADPEANFRVHVFEFRDITETMRIEKSLQATRDRAVQDMQLRADFFAKLNHEFRTPLNAVIGLSTLLQARSQSMPDDLTRKQVSLINQASEHLRELVQSTLQNAQSINFTGKAEAQVTPLAKVVDEAVAMLDHTAGAAGVSIDVDIDAGIELVADPRAIRQILLNVVGNAIRYNVPDGSVRIHADLDRPDQVALLVSDTGIGMSAENLAKCMQPYHRFAPGEGAGLGLSITSQLVAIMGGVITMTSEPGVGTVARVVLPKAPRTPGADLQGNVPSVGAAMSVDQVHGGGQI